ncbi:MAG: adenosylcobinamide-GDP ribazoletransferase [Fusobacteriaceae bacterium]|jgi:adenosylcobinamide-GDP ribazoletransferase|nr:adenosylcobinamide-GDP ribazoletransferase [Fusobacteriaceae bacterium]
MKGIILIFKFMTRFPLPQIADKNDRELGKSMKFFPLAGFGIGIFLTILARILGGLFPMKFILIATILTAVEIMITGDIHLRGLTVTYDSIFRYRSRQKMLDMMKDDAAIGTNGATALIFAILFKIVLLAAILPGFHLITLFFPVAARLNCVVNCAYVGPARNTGKGKLFADNTGVGDLVLSMLLTAACLAVTVFYEPRFEGYRFLLFLFLLVCVLVTMIAGYLYGYWMKKRIGGITGHTLGALVEQSEVVFLLTVFILLAGVFKGYV